LKLSAAGKAQALGSTTTEKWGEGAGLWGHERNESHGLGPARLTHKASNSKIVFMAHLPLH
jgi:hypothetical protein